MQDKRMLLVKSTLISIVLVAGVAFSAGNANASFFDKINESLKSVSAEVNKAQETVNKAEEKLNEEVENIETKVAEGQQKLDLLKDNAKAIEAEAKATAKGVEELATSTVDEL